MQNIIEKISTLLIEHENKSVNEFNAIFDENEELCKKIKESEKVLELQHQAIKKQSNSERVLNLNVEDLKRQSISFQTKNKTLEHQIKVLRKEAKTAREQIKRNKASNSALQAKLERLQKSSNGNNTNTSKEMDCIYSKGGDVLLIYPRKLTIGINDVQQEQQCLLYTNRSGCFVTVFLDNNNEVGVSTFINQESDIADRTKSLINKNTMQLSKDAASFAEQWLYRVNRVNNGRITKVDLIQIKD